MKKDIIRRGLGDNLSGVQKGLGKSPTGHLVASTFSGFVPDNHGNTYANAWNDPSVQQQRTYVIYAAVIVGGVVVAVYAVPAAAAWATTQGAVYAEIAAGYAATHPDQVQDGIEVVGVAIQAVADNPGDPAAAVVDTVVGGVSVIGPNAAPAIAARGLGKARGLNLGAGDLEICLEGSSIEQLPTLTFRHKTHPELAENISHAQQSGKPGVLTHGGNSNANRSAALDGVPNIDGLSRDEYPFASSMEGGAGSWVGHIPPSQQHSQGGLMKNFFLLNNIVPGDRYRVDVE